MRRNTFHLMVAPSWLAHRRGLGDMRAGSLFILLGALVAGCSSPGTPGTGFDLFPKSGNEARAILTPKNNSSVTGTITFTQRGDRVAIASTVHELTPGQHSFYIHQVGNCSSPNAASAGPVWSLPATPPGQKRLGALPELVAGTEGNADVMLVVRGLSVGDGGPNDVVGHAVVVHDGLDMDPRPEFGVRNGWLACGVIERKQADPVNERKQADPLK